MKVGEKVPLNTFAVVKGQYDVAVCGGGTAGCVAALTAARNGAKTVILEADYYLGGMMSGGNAGLTKFIKHGSTPDVQTKIVETLRKNPKEVQPVGGIPLELTHRLIQKKAAVGTGGTGASYVYTDSHEFKMMLFEMLRDAGVDIFLHSMITDVIKDGSRLKGVVVQTKEGRLLFLADYFIDATGDGDVAAFSGVPFSLGVGPEDSVYKQKLAELGTFQNIGSMFRIGGVDFNRYVDYLRTHPEHFAVQPFGFMTYEEFIKAYDAGEMIIGTGITPGGRRFQIYNYPHPGVMIGCISAKGSRNGLDTAVLTGTEYDIMLEAKNMVADIRNSLPGFEGAFVLDTPKAGVRETRHFKGEYILNILDILTQKEYEDTIGKSCHPVDIHPFPKEMEEIPKVDAFYFNIPYRCLLAYGVDNLLLAGRNVASTREAAGCTRPTVPCMITGEAAGTAAAMCAHEKIPNPKNINYLKLREQLKKQGAVV